MNRAHALQRSMFAVVTATLLACGGATEPAPPASLTVSASPSALTVQQGASGTIALSVTRANFNGAVSISIDGLPSGVTVSTTPNQLTSGITSANVNVVVASTVSTGTYTATVHASASGAGSAVATYALTVVEPPDFSLAASLNTATVSSAAPATRTVTITRTGGYTGSISFALQSARAGITGSFTPVSATDNSTTLVISATSAVPVGTYSATITGTGAGVGDRTTTISVTIVAPPDFSVSASPNSATLSSAAPSTNTINITRSGGYTGTVSLALQSAQAGITGAFTPPSGTGNTSTLVISASSAVPPGAYSATVTGSGADVGDRIATISVTVVAPPDFSLATTPNALTIVAGNNANTALTISRSGGFAGAVALTLTNAPLGVTAAFAPSSTTTNSSTVTVSVASTVAPGAYNATITGTATGPGSHTTTLSITVQAPVPTTSTFCDSIGLIVSFMAVQDGTTGAWTRVNDGATHTFTLTQSKGGVASIFYSAAADVLRVDTFFGTAAEIQAKGTESCAGRPFKTVTGTAIGSGGSDYPIFALGRSVNLTGGFGPFTMQFVPQGVLDFAARRSTLIPYALNRVLFRRGLTVADGGAFATTVDLGDNSTEAFAPLMRTLTVNEPGAVSFPISMAYRTAGGTTLPLTPGLAYLADFIPFPTVPPAKQIAGDLHILNLAPVGALAVGGSNRGASIAFFASTDKTMTLGPQPATVTITTLNAQAPVRLRVAIPVQAEYNKQIEATLTQDLLAGSSYRRTYHALYAAGYIGANSVLNVDVPDIAALGLPGLRFASPVAVGTIVTGWTGLGNLTFDGALTLHAERFLTYTP